MSDAIFLRQVDEGDTGVAAPQRSTVEEVRLGIALHVMLVSSVFKCSR